MSRSVLLEIAAASVEDALSAQSGGAARIELNSALSLGGLTPSLGLLLEVKASVLLPVIAMIRPRPGGFCYSAGEFRVMHRDLENTLNARADGIAVGILTDSGEIDVPRIREVIQAVGQVPVVFHRAFDLVPEPFAALEQLKDLGVRRVMTSGQEESAYNGAGRIADLIRRANGRIEILPAGGINRFNVADVIARTGCDQIHCGLRTKRIDPSARGRMAVFFGTTIKPAEDRYDAVDEAAVAQMSAGGRQEEPIDSLLPSCLPYFRRVSSYRDSTTSITIHDTLSFDPESRASWPSPSAHACTSGCDAMKARSLSSVTTPLRPSLHSRKRSPA
jgi:copper homeostasis protein